MCGGGGGISYLLDKCGVIEYQQLVDPKGLLSINSSEYSSLFTSFGPVPTTDLIVVSSACRPYLVSTLYLDRSLDSVARRSPCVRAPKLSRRLATILANLCSPERREIRNTYSGALT